MRLEGSLDAFSLPDIFQLLSFTKKTGGLHLRRSDLHGVVYVTSGALTGGASDIRRQALGRRLVGTGSIDTDAVETAVAEAGDDPEVGVARALLEAGAVEGEFVHELASEHVVDTVFDLLRWPEGDFAFVVDEVNPDDVGVSVPVEDAVAEARRRLDAWTSVSTTIPSPETVLAVALKPPDDPTLSREEWALLALVDGRRTVGQVVAATGRGEYAVVSTLAALVERGLLAVTSETQPSSVSTLLERLGAVAALEGLPAEEPAGSDPGPEPTDEASDEIDELADDDTDDDEDDDEDEEDDTDSVAEEPSDDQVDETIDDLDDLDDPADAAHAVEAAAEALTELSAPLQREAPDEVDTGARAAADDLAGPRDVVPPRAEAFLARRRPDHPDDDVRATSSMATVVGQVDGTAAVAPEPAPAFIERDPSVNKSLLLRLIAGVRGL